LQLLCSRLQAEKIAKIHYPRGHTQLRIEFPHDLQIYAQKLKADFVALIRAKLTSKRAQRDPRAAMT
jgi:hypothetical protein